MSEHLTNTQIVDSVNESNLETLGHSGALSMGYLDVVMAQTTGQMMNQAVTTQQNARIAGSASLIMACAKILQTPGKPPIQPVTVERGPVSPLADQG